MVFKEELQVFQRFTGVTFFFWVVFCFFPSDTSGGADFILANPAIFATFTIVSVERITERGPFHFGFNLCAGVLSFQVSMSPWSSEWTVDGPPGSTVDRILFLYSWIEPIVLDLI